MSRRTHGLVALLATATLVALLIAWWAPGRDPAEPTTTPTLPTSPTASASSSDSTASSSATAPTTAPPAVVVPGATISPCRRTGGTVPLTVVTFNIHSGIGRNGLQLAQVAGEIAAVEPDVVLLQEVDQNRLRSRFVDEADYLATALGMQHVFASNVERDGLRAGDPVSDYGTAVLTRLRIESWTHTLLPNRPGRQQRGLQHLVLRLGGRPISIYNAHLDHTTPSLRQQQMRLARDIIGVDGDPVIFGGDFNASAGSATLALALDPAHTDLVDPWPLVGDGDGLTVPNNAPRSRIDFLLADDDWRPTVMATWQSAVSDHRGVVGRFLLRSPRVCR
jgi:endonuclease/exonuclease/phosphatase family metal-dependent hydrolase